MVYPKTSTPCQVAIEILPAGGEEGPAYRKNASAELRTRIVVSFRLLP